MSALTNHDILRYAVDLPYFRGMYMRDTLPKRSLDRECGVVNLNTSHQPGSHWVCYHKDPQCRIYFDSFGQITPMEIQKYLKTTQEFEEDKSVIQRNTDIVQAINSTNCGQLCLMVLTLLSKGLNFQQVITALRDGYSQSHWKDPYTS